MIRLFNATRWAAVLALATSLGCKSLDVQNPNAPDAQRAFSDPSAVAGLITGAFKRWLNGREDFDGPLVLSHMALAHTSSWNNFNIRYYSSYEDCGGRCGWDNRPSSAYRYEIENIWYNMYGTLSNANDVLTAIRNNHVTISDVGTTKRAEAVAVMLQAMVFSQIALNYDQGFIVTEATDLSTPDKVKALNFSTRQELRDQSIAKFDEAIQLMTATPFTGLSEWFGKSQGPVYTSAQLIKLARTMQAELLAEYPRNSAENGQVNWAKVAEYASQGVSSGTGFDFAYFATFDDATFYDGVKQWGNDITTVRVHTRLAHRITGQCRDLAKTICPPPESVHQDPWPDPTGNPIPQAIDKRLGDGTWGPKDDFLGTGTIGPQDDGAGTDYAYAAGNIFRPARGQYHQSQLGFIRYSYLAYPGYGLPNEDGTGLAPIYTKTFNDLLWAEGLIRSGGSLTEAADLINKTRVTRGGLDPLTGAETTDQLLEALQYEQDVELLGMGATPFYNLRRLDQLQPLVPRHMPVPAKELQVLQRELYTFGGPGKPDASNSATDATGQRIRSVVEISDEIMANERLAAKRRNRH